MVGELNFCTGDHFAQSLVPKRYKDGQEGQVGGETEAWMRYRYYLHYAEGTIMPFLLVGLLIDRRSGPNLSRGLLLTFAQNSAVHQYHSSSDH